MTPVVLSTFHKARQGVDAAFGTYVSAGIYILLFVLPQNRVSTCSNPCFCCDAHHGPWGQKKKKKTGCSCCLYGVDAWRYNLWQKVYLVCIYIIHNLDSIFVFFLLDGLPPIPDRCAFSCCPPNSFLYNNVRSWDYFFLSYFLLSFPLFFSEEKKKMPHSAFSYSLPAWVSLAAGEAIKNSAQATLGYIPRKNIAWQFFIFCCAKEKKQGLPYYRLLHLHLSLTRCSRLTTMTSFLFVYLYLRSCALWTSRHPVRNHQNPKQFPPRHHTGTGPVKGYLAEPPPGHLQICYRLKPKPQISRHRHALPGPSCRLVRHLVERPAPGGRCRGTR